MVVIINLKRFTFTEYQKHQMQLFNKLNKMFKK